MNASLGPRVWYPSMRWAIFFKHISHITLGMDLHSPLQGQPPLKENKGVSDCRPKNMVGGIEKNAMKSAIGAAAFEV